jgi:serine protease Do
MTNERNVIEAAERYLKGEMNAEERKAFENERKLNPELDQYVVDHDLFMNHLVHHGNLKQFKHLLNETHSSLISNGQLEQAKTGRTLKMKVFWNRYRRTVAIAASIAGIIAISINAITFTITPKGNEKQVQELVNTVNAIKIKQTEQDNQIKSLSNPKLPSDQVITGSGTAFMIDNQGILVTNAHVLRNAHGAILTNSKGMEFRANIIYTDITRDIALLRINDTDYVPKGNIPYSLRKTTGDLAEPIFTLGYPYDKFVYGEGYLSSFTGHQGDTLSCQIAVAANPGNSGGPVFNRNGEVIGILSKREIQAEGVVYAIRAGYIIEAVNEIQRKDNPFCISALPPNSTLRGLDKTIQVKKIQDFVYLVKAY